MKIAGLKTIDEWNNLHLLLNIVKNDSWDKAFEFFDKRIDTRYLTPIDEILRMRVLLGEGFAIVNLQCSLIETIECFVQGWKYKSKQIDPPIKLGWYKSNNELKEDIDNEAIFCSFFDNRKEFKKSNQSAQIKGDDFYKSVRCGLLHETQTLNNWKIRRNDSRMKFDWYEENNEEKIIYSYQLNNVLKSLIERYRKAIVEGNDFDEIPNSQLRENFLEKMNHICTKSIKK